MTKITINFISSRFFNKPKEFLINSLKHKNLLIRFPKGIELLKKQDIRQNMQFIISITRVFQSFVT